jgi:CRP-like cAMP-binding protein
VSENLSQVRPDTSPPILDLDLSDIGGNRLLNALPPADFDLLAPDIVKVSFAQGSVLHEPGQPIARAYFLESGLVSLFALLPEGHAVGTCSIGREGALGLAAALYPQTALTRAVVHVPVSAAEISVARLAEAATRSKPIRDMILCYNDGLLEQTSKLLACNTVHQVSQRLCRWLLQAYDRTGDDTLLLTQDCLAGVLGVQRTTVTMIASTLQADGIIKVRRGRIQIQDFGALERRSCVCYSNGRSSDT